MPEFDIVELTEPDVLVFETVVPVVCALAMTATEAASAVTKAMRDAVFMLFSNFLINMSDLLGVDSDGAK